MLMQWKTTPSPFFNDFRGLSRQVDEMFREMFPAPKARRSRRGFTVEESDDAFTLRASLPGMSPEDLSLEVHEGTLKVAAKRSSDVPEGYRALRRERAELAFERSFTLGTKVDVEAIEAKLDDGVLTITLPKRSEQKPRQITITAA